DRAARPRPAGVRGRGDRRTVAGVLAERGGGRRVHLSRAVLTAGMAAARADEPVSRVYGNDQLRSVPAAQDPVRHGEEPPRGPASADRAADSVRRVLRDGDTVLDRARKTVPQARTEHSVDRFTRD